MKKLVLIVGLSLVVCLIGTKSYAETIQYFDGDKHRHHNHDTIRELTIHDKAIVPENSDNEIGVKADAPYLVKVKEDWFIGVEGGKDLEDADINEGWFAFLKVTFTGTIFDFSKKE